VEFVAIFSKYGKEINEEYIRKTVLNWRGNKNEIKETGINSWDNYKQ
jgi:hypothetical protein